jgi:dimeric dUTPase (all-alpha-NTP-PPase superfamily)
LWFGWLNEDCFLGLSAKVFPKIEKVYLLKNKVKRAKRLILTLLGKSLFSVTRDTLISECVTGNFCLLGNFYKVSRKINFAEIFSAFFNFNKTTNILG